MLLWPLIFSYFVSLTVALTCIQSSALPLESDCNELIEMVRAYSLRRGQGSQKRWGRRVQDTATTMQLPKHYFIYKPGESRQNTCLINIDALGLPQAPDYDVFTLGRVVVSAIVIKSHCISNQHAIGWDFPGPNHAVYIKVERASQMTPMLQIENGTQIAYTATLGNSTAELRELTGDITSSLPNPVEPQTS